MSHHPIVDLAHWLEVFPIEKLRDEHEEYYRQFPAWQGKSRESLRRLSCRPISTPHDLAKLEQLREPIIEEHSIEEAVPVDLFLWQSAAPTKPWLTRIGGNPYRHPDSPWPTDSGSGLPYTFVAQFCFLDSLDVLPVALPGDVLLIYFRGHEAVFESEDSICVEWVKVEGPLGLPQSGFPKPGFPIPCLSGVRHRHLEFPDERELFKNADCDSSYWLPVSQSTKIGTEAFFIQGYPDVPDDSTLIATLNSLELSDPWPLVDKETLPKSTSTNDIYGWGDYEMMFGDVGCLYIFLDKLGSIHWRFDCF